MRYVIAAIPAICLLVACGEDDSHGHPGRTTGKQLFEYHCVHCHRDSGGGSFLEGVPRLKESTLTGHQMTEHIRGGSRPEDTRMPEFATMPEAEARLIADYIRTELQPK